MRRRAVAAAALAVLVAAVGAGEALGWPFLAGPLEGALTQALQRRVSLATQAPDQEKEPGFRVRFLGGLRLQAPYVEIAAPAWSDAPHTLQAEALLLELRYIDLWRAHRGQPLHIQRLQARQLDGDLERRADGRATWPLGELPAAGAAATPPAAVPSVGHLQVDAGRLRYRDAVLALDLDTRWSLEAAANPDPGAGAGPVLRLATQGRYRGLPVQGEAVAAGALPWTVDAATAAAVPVHVQATIGRARFSFDGRSADALHLGGLTGRFSLQGPSLAAVGDPLGVTLPTTRAFRSAGRLAKQGDTWHVVVDEATVGSSRLNGAFRYDGGRAVPVLTGRLGGSRLMLVDLGPAVGVATPEVADKPPAGKLLPTRPFDLPSLRAMDANVLVDVAEVDLDTTWLQPLRPVRTHLQLAGGVLTLRDLDARTAQGRLRGDLTLDGRAATALWTADLRWSAVRLEQWIRQTRAAGAPPYVTGRLNGRAKVQGQGRSTAEILASLSGTLRSELREGTVSHLAIEAAGLDLAQALGVLIKGDDSLPVYCAVADLAVDKGALRPRVMVLDTRDSTVWVDGSLSLAQETLDLRGIVVPKDFSPLALRTPLNVRGSFADPQVSLQAGPLAGKLAASALLALVNPLAALLPLIDTGDGDSGDTGMAGCRNLKPPKADAAPAPAAPKG